MKRVAIVDPSSNVIVHVIWLEDGKIIQPDRLSAVGPAEAVHQSVTVNDDGVAAFTETPIHYEATYEAWMHNEAHRGFVLAEDTKEEAQVGGTWTSNGGFVARVIPPEEIEEIRQRNRDYAMHLLVISAWSQAPDEPDDVRETWAAYRAKVREVRDTADPLKVEWPTPPTA